MLTFFVPAACLMVVSTVFAQFVSAPNDLISVEGYANIPVRYKQVPSGICEQNPSVKSYSGYADVAPDQHIFFWFFEARNTDPTQAPLTVWLNGLGPSMEGLFQENGPCHVDSNGKVHDNPYSWSNASNMLYIDQPTQVGFSYSIPVAAYLNPKSGEITTLPDNNCSNYAVNNCGTYSNPNVTLTANSTGAAAASFWATLQGFMGAFPQYSRRNFNLAAERDGGYFAPFFGQYIESQNAMNMPHAQNISVETLLIGNGWYDPLIHYQSYYNFTVSPGNTYDFYPFNESVASKMYNGLYGAGNCVDRLKDCAASEVVDVCTSADNFCSGTIFGPYVEIAKRNIYDIRELDPDPFPYSYYIKYLNDPAVQIAIGAFVNYTEDSSIVDNVFSSTDSSVSSVNDIIDLLQQGVIVVLYNGDADFLCNWLGVEEVSNQVGAPEFSTAGYVNLSTSDNVVHGQVKQSGSFSFVRVYESGEQVPFYQPLASLAIFQRAISGKDIATGIVDVTSNYTTEGPVRSLFREGNSTVQFSVLNSHATYNITINGPNSRSNAENVRSCSGFIVAMIVVIVAMLVI